MSAAADSLGALELLDDARLEAEPRPLVFLHGFGLNPSAYEGPLRRLRLEHGEVIAPPIGLSHELWSMQGVVEWLSQHLEVRLRAPAVLVGHSLGGAVATVLAHARPDLVARLVLVNALGISIHGRTAANWVSALPRYLTSIPIGVGLSVASDFVRHPSRAINWASAGAWALHGDLEPQLRTLGETVPAAVIWGTRDRLVPLADGYRMAELLNAPLLEVPGDHEWPLRDPAVFASSVARAIESATGQRST